MNPRARTTLVVAAVAAFAAVVVAGAAVLSAEEIPPPAAAGAPAEPQPGAPILALDLVLRDDAEAKLLADGIEAYEAERLAEAARIFGRSDSLEAKLGAAFAAWPGSIDRVEQLGALYPRSAMAQLHVGLARFWAGRPGAVEAWRAARDVEPDTPYAIRANDLLHSRDYVPGLPVLVVAARAPDAISELPPAEQLDALRRRAEDGRLEERLLYGIALQRVGRPVSAREVYSEAARAFPDEPEALVADAVGRFSKARPEAAFSRLGPLTRRFPGAATVRFHLGLLLLWRQDIEPARRQLRLARAAEPGSFIARSAQLYLDRLAAAGTG